MDLARIPQLVRNTRRFREVTSTLVKYGLGSWLTGWNVEWVQQLFKTMDGRRIADLAPGARIRLALTELGPTFIKLGQILSTRSDLIGPDISAELAQLQTATPALSADVIRPFIEAELQRPIGEVFADFDDEAIASASIAQIHRARRHDGRDVVVKVQHPDIEGRIRNDIEILTELARLAEEIAPQLRYYQPRSTAAGFARTLLRELDFTREARNMKQFARQFDGDDDVVLPEPYPDASSRRVLTMDYLDGIPVSRPEDLVKAGNDLGDLARRGARIFLDMIFRDGFYHADPHPGNLLVLTGGVIGVLDCGMVGRLDEELREQVEDMILAMVGHDASRLTETVARIGNAPEEIDVDALRRDLDELLGELRDLPIHDLDLRSAIESLFGIIREHHVLLPPSIAMLLKVLVMLEGTSRNLNPDFSLAEVLEPYRKRAIRRRASPRRLRRRVESAYRDWSRLAEMLPGDAADILQRIKRGKFDVHLDHRRLDSIVNRLVLGILVAALFVGSALLWSREVPPMLAGYSLPGSVGCIVAVGLGWRLLRAITQTGSLHDRH